MEEYENHELTKIIIGCCYEVHNQLGPGFLEKIYANALKIKLQQAGLSFEVEKEFVVIFEGHLIGKFRCDLVVENKVIVELKSITGFQPKLFQHQVVSYLKASKIKTGLLINFGNISCEVKRYRFNLLNTTSNLWNLQICGIFKSVISTAGKMQ